MLDSPVRWQGKGPSRSASAELSRKCLHQVAKWAAIPVAQRATVHLIRELDIASFGGGGEVADEAVKKYSAMFQGPLAPKAIAVIRAATRLENERITEAAMTMTMDELAA
jgi:hypothetical protein